MNTTTGKYRVLKIESPWLGGVGHISGLPVARVVLVDRSTGGGRLMDAYEIADEIKRTCAIVPRWVAFDGQHDSYLHSILRVRLKCLFYAEVDGTKSCTDESDHHVMLDHVAVRISASAKNFGSGLLFHSVITELPRGVENAVAMLKALSTRIDLCGAQVHRYLLCPSSQADMPRAIDVVSRVGGQWRLTRPIAASNSVVPVRPRRTP